MKLTHLATALLISLSMLACASRGAPDDALAQRIDTLLPADAVLLGEQHDAADHQRIARQVITALAERQQLAAVVIEMAERGNNTAALQPGASEAQVQAALRWDDSAWPWRAYGPAVMAAVRAGRPVLGANVPRGDLRASMQNAALDSALPPSALAAQQQGIRTGHCGMLPEAQIAPMTRMQIARDQSMASVIERAQVPGQVVLFMGGSGHVDRTLGVPQHLRTGLNIKAVQLLAGSADAPSPGYDAVWPTPPLPPVDYCTQFKSQMLQAPGK
jgi:uncharacterized iron-regulated protein